MHRRQTKEIAQHWLERSSALQQPGVAEASQRWQQRGKGRRARRGRAQNGTQCEHQQHHCQASPFV